MNKELLLISELYDILINVPNCKIGVVYVNDVYRTDRHVMLISGLSLVADYLNKQITQINDGSQYYPNKHFIISSNGFEYYQVTSDGVLY